MTKRASTALWLTPADAQRLKLNVLYILDQGPPAEPAHAYTVPATAPTVVPAAVAPLPAATAATPQPASAAGGVDHPKRMPRDTPIEWLGIRGLIRRPAVPARRRSTGLASETRQHPAPCAAVHSDPELIAGCKAAEQRLASVDVHRKTEANYWWGWNSI